MPSCIRVSRHVVIFSKAFWGGGLQCDLSLICSLIPCCSLTMGQLYDKEKDEDGFLYVAYSGENTFGF